MKPICTKNTLKISKEEVGKEASFEWGGLFGIDSDGGDFW